MSVEFVDAREIGEALEELAAHGDDATVLAGGTDVVMQMHQRERRPKRLVHVLKIPELGGITATTSLFIGATTTHRQLVTSEPVQTRHRALAEAAATVGGRQTQNIGTIAGNIVNASPAADLVPALLVADASVSLIATTGSRSVPLSEFIVGRRQTTRSADELVSAVSLEAPPPATGETYLKVGRRKAMEVAIVGLAARLTLDSDGTIGDARVAVCSVGPKPFRAPEVEEALVGRRPDEGPAIAEAGRLLEACAQPIDDVRGTAGYRKAVLGALLARAVGRCSERATAASQRGE